MLPLNFNLINLKRANLPHIITMRLYISACFVYVLFGLFLPFDTIAQSAKTLHQTFQTDNAQKININVVGSKVEMRETKGSRILVEMTIILSVPNERLLDFVINKGRYDLSKELDSTTGELTISSQRTNNVLIVQGKECYEEINYIFYIPPSIKYANNSTIESFGRD